MTYIVRVGADDFRLRYLHDACFPHDREPAWSLGAWWIAVDGDKPVAFAGVQPSLQWRDAGYLVRAGVVPSHRGKGLQRRLIQVRVAHAKKMGWNWLITATYQNPASANSLIRCGFTMYEPANPWLAKGALYWRRRL